MHFDWKFEPDHYVSKTTFLMFPFFLFLLQLFLLYIEDKKGEPQNQTIMTGFIGYSCLNLYLSHWDRYKLP